MFISTSCSQAVQFNNGVGLCVFPTPVSFHTAECGPVLSLRLGHSPEKDSPDSEGGPCPVMPAGERECWACGMKDSIVRKG